MTTDRQRHTDSQTETERIDHIYIYTQRHTERERDGHSQRETDRGRETEKGHFEFYRPHNVALSFVIHTIPALLAFTETAWPRSP